MIRRSFLSHLGKVAAVTLSPSLLESSPLPPSMERSEHAAAEIINGSSSLKFVKGPSGLGLELSIRRESSWRRVASVQSPVRVFYDRRGNDSEKNVEFSSVLPAGEGLVTSAELTDARHNRWLIRFQVSKWKAEGFRCEFNYELLEGQAHNVFFEHSVVPDLAASPDDTYVLMPGLLYDGNRLARPDGEVPRLIAANQFQLDTPVLSLSTTATLLHEKATGATLVTMTEVESGLGPSGFSYAIRPGHHQLAVVVPLYREKHFHGHHYEDCTPEGANVLQGQSFKLTVFHLPTQI